jgi:CheY-like chemotaxis protein
MSEHDASTGQPPAADPSPAPSTASDSAVLARDAFLAAMSHELRTPMVGVLGFANLLADTPLDHWQREFVHAIEQCGQELLATIDHVLLASALEAGAVHLDRRPFALRPTLEETLSRFAPKAAGKRLGLTLEVAPDVPGRIVGDAAQLAAVVGHLIDNAIKFTDAGSVRLTVGSASDGGRWQLCVSVRDTGIGVAPQLRGALFRAFAQADGSSTRRHGGMGLGLAICRRLIELMGGTIGVDGAAGEGSRFWFSVPAEVAAPVGTVEGTVDAPPRASLRPEPHAVAPEAAGDAEEVRVLVVDDQPVNQKVARHVLERLGCRVDLAVDGVQAVERAVEARYDLILMDCHMPGMDGFEATREIRRREPRIGHGRTPIVALTASAPEAARDPCYAAGMDAFLSKPVEPEALGSVLRRFTLLGRRRSTAAAPASASG